MPIVSFPLPLETLCALHYSNLVKRVVPYIINITKKLEFNVLSITQGYFNLLVGALSPVNNNRLYQGWKHRSIHLLTPNESEETAKISTIHKICLDTNIRRNIQTSPKSKQNKIEQIVDQVSPLLRGRTPRRRRQRRDNDEEEDNRRKRGARERKQTNAGRRGLGMKQNIKLL